jgi:predicted O-methyltransferase YrrM
MPVRTVAQRHLLWHTIVGDIKHAVTRRHEFRYQVVRELWSVAKRFGARGISSVELRQIEGLGEKPMTGFFDDPQRLVVAALCDRLGAQTFFEFGTYWGRTAWTVARNNPGIRVFTLDLPNRDAASHVQLEFTDQYLLQEWRRGEAFQETAEADRIERPLGDSAAFDYSPYEASIDLVYIDGSHSYSYVKNDTEAALRMLSPRGAIVWDDYPGYGGVYAYLEEFAQRHDTTLLHLQGTRLVIYSRQPLLTDVAAVDRPVAPPDA